MARLGPSSTLLRHHISLLHLSDVKPSNGLYTWNNRRIGVAAITERLDIFLVSFFWVSGTLTFSSEILDWRGFDHWPIKFSAIGVIILKCPHFKFQLMWFCDSSLHDFVLCWWKDDTPPYGTVMFSFSKRLQYVKRHLSIWNRNFFGTFTL